MNVILSEAKDIGGVAGMTTSTPGFVRPCAPQNDAKGGMA
jgi:hypothetical protein